MKTNNWFKPSFPDFLTKKSSIFILILCTYFSDYLEAANSSLPRAIIGGQGSAPYAALLESDGSLLTLALPPTGLTYRVAINSSGEGLVGGTDALNAYAAAVAPNGLVTPIAGLIAPGEIYTVAINESGNGIIGGGHFNTNIPYAALVTSSAAATSISGLPASGLIYSVAIDSYGEGIIGGIGPAYSAYAALISTNAAATTLVGLPNSGKIFWVAANDSKMRFIGGQAGTSVYAAFVTPNSSLLPIANLPTGLNYSVGINAAGAAIMGGTSANVPYAALVSPSGAVTTLSGLPSTPGIIYTVMINDTGTGLIAGFSALGPYGSFVAPNGVLTPLCGLPTGEGFLDGAAIHESGVGLVGGTSYGVPFAALAAPNGTLTYLSGLPNNGEINSTAIAILDNLVPKSLGIFDSWANTQFTLADTLTQHCMLHHRNWGAPCACLCNDTANDCSSVWLSLFGNCIHERAEHAIPAFSNTIGGALLGFDYKDIQDVVLGSGIAYAYNYVNFRHQGHAKINQESAVLYASWNRPYFYLNVALWGGGFQASHKRHSLFIITSKASPFGWNLSPHLELSTPFCLTKCQRFVADPFVALDWAHNWQCHFHEHGRSGFNLILNNQYAAIFRSELGVRFFETFQLCWGQLIIEEKISYVNRTPTHKGNSCAYFLGANSAFNVETLNRTAQNQAKIQLHLECLPTHLHNIYSALDYQGEFGSVFQSHMLTFTFGKNF